MIKGVVQDKEAVGENIRKAIHIEVLEMAKYSDGTESVTYKIVI
jgi:hypothetical protein